MKRRMTLIPALAMLAAAGTLAACGGDGEGAAPPAEPAPPPAEPAEPAEAGETLVGTVGPGFTITLTYDGAPVTELAAGSYTIEVSDESDIHDFHLTGPGVDETTDVGGTGETTWTVDLQPGEYTFVCDPHAGSMKGSFTVS